MIQTGDRFVEEKSALCSEAFGGAENCAPKTVGPPVGKRLDGRYINPGHGIHYWPVRIDDRGGDVLTDRSE